MRARVTNPTTGRMEEIRKVLPEADQAAAFKWLSDERARVRAGLGSAQLVRTRFGDFAISVLEHKVQQGHLRSQKSAERWKYTLEHLIGGTVTADGARHVPGFGDFFVDQIRPEHVEQWRAGVLELIASGQYSPNTTNSWLSILRVIAREAKRRHKLRDLFTEGVPDFDTSEHVTYTEEAPNSLTSEQVPLFLTKLLELHPRHYAMSYLGLATGLRPSSLRPLRRCGETPDVQWESCRLFVRRSQTSGQRVLNTTKQKKRYCIELPKEVMEVLRWHTETQLVTPEQQGSELLFPSVTGGYRSPTVLNKPFAEVSEAIGLGYSFTQIGMRRTFNDLARTAQVEAIVTRSISGHLTERMQDHYSTVQPEEQRESIARVIDLMTARRAREAADSQSESGGATDDPPQQNGASGGTPSGTPDGAIDSENGTRSGPPGVQSGTPGGTPLSSSGTPKGRVG